MKKKFLLILLLVFAMSASLFVGCGKVEFKLNFVVDEEVYATISTNGKEAIKLPENPEKVGYVFDGWYWDNEVWKRPFTANSLLDTPISSDMSVYAKFEKEEAVKGTQAEFVGFEKVGENKYFKKVSNDTKILSLDTLVKVNSKSSWIASYDVSCTKVILSKIAELTAGDNLCYVNVTDENGNMLLYTLNIRRRKIYEVSFADSDVQSQYIEEDSCAVAPATANRNGYTFESWDFDFTTRIVENTVITAKWNVVTYNIEYELNGGENNSLNPTTYTIESEEIVLQVPSKTGYDFIGWYADEALTKKVEKIVEGSFGNKKFYAKWQVIVYTIEYELNGGENNSLNPTTYTIESEDIVLQTPSKTGYDFDGWYTDEALTKKAEKIVTGSYGNKKFYAKWQVIVYSITYELNGGENNPLNPTTYTIESEEIVLQAPTIQSEDYDGFIGWFSDKEFMYEVQSIKQGSYGNKTFYAKWSSKYYLFDTFYKKITGLTDYGKTCDSLVIPDKINGIDVSIIGNSAFAYCIKLKNVSFGNNVTQIYNRAFYNCSALKSITISKSVVSFCTDGGPKKEVFTGCTSLTDIYYVGNVASWCGIDGLFSVMSSSLTLYIEGKKVEGELVIPDGVTSIGANAFKGCVGLKSVTIPNNVKSIGVSAFNDCTGLTSVIIGNSVVKIGSSAFRNCSGLKSVYYTGDVASWCGISGLDYIMSSSRTLYIGGKMVEGGLIIPDNVKSIEGSAFRGCTGLTSATIGNSVANIGSSAFRDCIGLTSVTIPNSVVEIDSYAFNGCSSLKTIYYKGTEEEWNAIIKDSAWISGANYTIIYNA